MLKVEVNYPTLTLSGTARASSLIGNRLGKHRTNSTSLWSDIPSTGRSPGSRGQNPQAFVFYTIFQ